MAKSVLVTMPAKLEAEKIASWLSRLVHNVEVGPSDGNWGIFVPQAALHRAQTALKKVLAAANPGRRIVARPVRALPKVRFNGSKGIPKGQIQWLVERLHVGTTHDEVEKEIRKRTTGAGWTPAKVREAVAYAIKCHQKNRGVFAHVMRTIPNPNGRECCKKLGAGVPCAKCGKHTHFTVDWIIPARVVDDRPACSSACALALKKSPATNPVNKRARREARRAEIRVKEQLGLRGRPLARRGPWAGGKDAYGEGQRAGSGYVRFWFWNDREWGISLRSSYDGVEGEPSLRESAKWAADEEAEKKNVAAKFPGQGGMWKAGFVLAFEKAIAAAFGPKKEWSEEDEDWKDEREASARRWTRLAKKKKRAVRIADARAKRGLSPNPSREVREARVAKVKMLLVRIKSILQAGEQHLRMGRRNDALESSRRADALWGQMPKGVAMVSPQTRREAYELSQRGVRLRNGQVSFNKPKKNPGERYLIQAIRPKHRNWVTIDYAQDETRALLNALHRARLGKGVTYRVWDTDKVEEVWRGTGAEASIERWKKIRPAGLVGANRRTTMNRNPRLSKKMHALRENTMRLGDAMKYGRILLDAGVPIHLWDGSGWEVAIKPNDSYSTSSGRAASGGRRYLAQGAGLIKTWPITLLSDAIQPGAFIGVAAIRHFLQHRRSGVASNGRACPNPLCKATSRKNPGAAPNVLIQGKDLNQRQFEQVLNAFVHRWTTGNAARLRVYKCPVCKVPGGDPNGGVACRQYHPTIPLITDNQWVKEHAFHFTKDGSRLMHNKRHAEPAYMAKENPRRPGGLRPKRVKVFCHMCGEWDPAKGPYKDPHVEGWMKGRLACLSCRRGIAQLKRSKYDFKRERMPGQRKVRRNSDTVNANERVQHEQIVGAFLAGQKKKVGPRYWTDGTLLRVWGNLVAKRDHTGVELYDAGYRTLLTKNILNTVLRHLGQGTIFQKGFTWYISTPQGNKTWPGNWTVLTDGAAANRRRVARNGRGENLTIADIEQWVNNDEGLYRWWKSERTSLRAFVRANRAELERVIQAALNRPPREKTWRDYAGQNPRIWAEGTDGDGGRVKTRKFSYRKRSVRGTLTKGYLKARHRVDGDLRRIHRQRGTGVLNVSIKHSGLTGLMKNGDAKKAMRFA